MSGLRQPVSKFRFLVADGCGAEKDVTERVLAALSENFGGSEVNRVIDPQQTFL